MANIPLQVQELSIGFESGTGVTAITDRVSFELRAGEVLGLVGESGCGKSVTALALLRLLPVPGGRVLGGRITLNGRDVLSLSPEELRSVRGREVAMIFQEPSAALNPVRSIGAQLNEVFEYHPEAELDTESKSGADGPHGRQERLLHMLKRVGIPDPARILASYPHQLSGGMLQRVVIAMALLLRPAVVIADEPTTALDVTVQAQIMELLVELQREEGTAVLLITHNLGLIAQYADRLAVMYAGRVVEEGPVESFLKNPLHPYSRGLLGALPDLTQEKLRLTPIEGQVPQPRDYDVGCRFRDRCAQAFTACAAPPALRSPAGESDERRVACFLYETPAAAQK